MFIKSPSWNLENVCFISMRVMYNYDENWEITGVLRYQFGIIFLRGNLPIITQNISLRPTIFDFLSIVLIFKIKQNSIIYPNTENFNYPKIICVFMQTTKNQTRSQFKPLAIFLKHVVKKLKNRNCSKLGAPATWKYIIKSRLWINNVKILYSNIMFCYVFSIHTIMCVKIHKMYKRLLKDRKLIFGYL